VMFPMGNATGHSDFLVGIVMSLTGFGQITLQGWMNRTE